MKNKIKSRRCVTLLELLIAMALTMMIMSAMGYFYRQLDAINQEMEVQQKELFKQLYLSTRLMDIVPKAVSPQSKKKDFFFYTASASDAALLPGMPSLTFTYYNGVKLDARFSENVLGKLFVDKDRRLCMAVWPSTARWEEFHNPPMKCEILLEGVNSIAFRFYIPAKKEREKVWEQARMKVKMPDTFPAGGAGEWRTDWPAEWKQLPAIVEITLKTDKSTTPLVLSYPLPNSNFIVVY